MESSGVSDIGEDFSDRDFGIPQPVGFPQHADVVHAVSHGMSPRHAGGTTWCATHLGVKAGEHDPFAGHLVQTRSFKPSNLLNCGNANVSVGGIIPHDVNDIGGALYFSRSSANRC